MALTALDRCDRYMALAVVQADSLNWRSTLLFCAHHFKEHKGELTRLGVLIVDDRDNAQVTP